MTYTLEDYQNSRFASLWGLTACRNDVAGLWYTSQGGYLSDQDMVDKQMVPVVEDIDKAIDVDHLLTTWAYAETISEVNLPLEGDTIIERILDGYAVYTVDNAREEFANSRDHRIVKRANRPEDAEKIEEILDQAPNYFEVRVQLSWLSNLLSDQGIRVEKGNKDDTDS